MDGEAGALRVRRPPACVGSCGGPSARGRRAGGGGGEARNGRARDERGARCRRGRWKKPPVEPQAGPEPGAGRAAGEKGLPGSFLQVIKKLMGSPRTRLGEEAVGKVGWGRALLGREVSAGQGL